MNSDGVSNTWILQLETVRRVNLTTTSEFSMETHMLEFTPKTVGQYHRDMTNPCWLGRSYKPVRP
jgi:hypothetical protein